MKSYWENDGAANAEGKFVAVIDMEDGSRAQRFLGDSQKEVADKLLDAQANATQKIIEQSRRINELKPVEPGKPVRAFKPRALTADERFKVTRDMADPATAPEAVKTVVESELGAPLSEVREALQENDQERLAEDTAAAAGEFAAQTPLWYPTESNKRKLLRQVELNAREAGQDPNAALTVAANYEKAFEELKTDGLLQFKPEPQPAPPAAPANSGTQVRPRGVIASSGIRSSDSSGVPPATGRAPKQGKYTKEQVINMPASEYRKNYQDPEFRKMVDELFAQPTA